MTDEMVFSQALEDRIRVAATDDSCYRPSECCSMTSTTGYDNDGSTGPELIENGVGLGMILADERSGAGHADAKIFYADDDDDTRYYQVGANEKDALARLNRLMIR